MSESNRECDEMDDVPPCQRVSIFDETCDPPPKRLLARHLFFYRKGARMQRAAREKETAKRRQFAR